MMHVTARTGTNWRVSHDAFTWAKVVNDVAPFVATDGQCDGGERLGVRSVIRDDEFEVAVTLSPDGVDRTRDERGSVVARQDDEVTHGVLSAG